MHDFILNNKLIISIILVVGALLVKWCLMRYLKRLPASESELPKRWMNIIRNAITALIVIGLIIIWLSELRFVALSIATFTVALIIATREFIQCFLGALYQASTRPFSIGDWIKVGDHHGEVVSSDWLTTKLLEIDIISASYSYTGRTITIPNNYFVANPVYNFNFMRRYVAHTFSIVRDAEPIDTTIVKEAILKKAESYCQDFQEVAHRYASLIEKHLGIKLSESGASVRITTTNLGKNQFTFSVFCPTQEAVNIEQKIIENFIQLWNDQLLALKEEKDQKTETEI